MERCRVWRVAARINARRWVRIEADHDMRGGLRKGETECPAERSKNEVADPGGWSHDRDHLFT